MAAFASVEYHCKGITIRFWKFSREISKNRIYMRQSSFSCEFYERFCTRFWNRKILTTAFLFCYLIPKLLYFILIVWLRQYLFGWHKLALHDLKVTLKPKSKEVKNKSKKQWYGYSFLFLYVLELINALWHASDLLGQISLACTKNASFPAE